MRVPSVSLVMIFFFPYFIEHGIVGIIFIKVIDTHPTGSPGPSTVLWCSNRIIVIINWK